MTTGASHPQISMLLKNFFAEDPGEWDTLIERAKVLDRAGIDRLVVSDHVVMGTNLDAYTEPSAGGVAGGRQPTGPDGVWLEPMTLLAVLAGVTEQIRLGTAILLAGLRRPIVLAKAATTLDTLSGGRFDLGVGVGWQREEYEAAGLDYDDRGRTLDHTLDVLRTVWENRPASYESDSLSFRDVYVVPGPTQSPSIPIWVSGRINRHVIDRIVAYGTGWIPWGDDAKDPTQGVRVLREALEAGGRDPAQLQVVGTLPTVTRDDGSLDVDSTMAAVPALVDAGITDFRAYVRTPNDSAEAIDFLSGVVAAFREAVGRS